MMKTDTDSATKGCNRDSWTGCYKNTNRKAVNSSKKVGKASGHGKV